MQHQYPRPLSRAESMSQTCLTLLLIFITNSSSLAEPCAICGNQWPCFFIYSYILRSGPARRAPFVTNCPEPGIAISLLTTPLVPWYTACACDLFLLSSQLLQCTEGNLSALIVMLNMDRPKKHIGSK